MGSRSFRLRGLSVLQQHFQGLQMVFLSAALTASAQKAKSVHRAGDRVVVAVTVSPEGKVEKTKVVSGKIGALREAVNKTIKKWTFQPYVVNGTPVPVRTE